MNKEYIRESFNLAHQTYDEVAIVQREIADRALGRLEYIKLKPSVVVDLGAGTGYGCPRLQSLYPNADVIAVDFAEQLLAQVHGNEGQSSLLRVCADAEQLPFEKNSVDIVFTSLMLHWLTDIPGFFTKVRQILKPDGILLFSTLGPGTLTELRQSWQAAESGHTHVNQFIDLHHIGDWLLQAQFVDPVVDMENIVLTYRKLKTLLMDLKQLGAHNLTENRPEHLLGKQTFKRFVAAYENFRQDDGLLPATYEVVYGYARAPANVTTALNDAGEASISLDDILIGSPFE